MFNCIISVFQLGSWCLKMFLSEKPFWKLFDRFIHFYLAPNCVWERAIVKLMWVCLSFCDSVINGEKFGRKLRYHKRNIKDEFDKKHLGRVHTLLIRKVTIDIKSYLDISQKVLDQMPKKIFLCVMGFHRQFVNLRKIGRI